MRIKIKIFPFFLSLVIVSLFIVLASFVSTHVSAQKENSNDHVPGQVLVKFKDGTPQNVIDAETRKQNGKVASKIDKLNVLVLKAPQAAEEKVVAALSQNPNVEYAELDYIATALMIPNDPYFSNQWGLENTGQTIVGQVGTPDADIDAEAAWKITTGTSSVGPVKVAILDTGIDQDHPELSPKIDLQQDFTGSGSVNDYYGHGTHVSGIVAAITNNSIGVAGVCPDCLLVNGKVLNDSGSGAYSWVAKGITWAADNGAKVINMSLGGSIPSKTLEKAVNYAWGKNVVVVAAAGNSGNTSKTYPGAYTNAIAVAATDNQDNKASFSEYGSWVDVAAPGVDIFSTFPNHPYKINKSPGYDFGSGTSMATPMTSGVVALIWSTGKYTTASDVRSRLELTADKIPGTGTYWSAGRVNAASAVGDYIVPSPTPAPTSTPKPGKNR